MEKEVNPVPLNRRNALKKIGGLSLGVTIGGCGGGEGDNKLATAAGAAPKRHIAGESLSLAINHIVGYTDRESYAQNEKICVYLSNESGGTITEVGWDLKSAFDETTVASGVCTVSEQPKKTGGDGNQSWPKTFEVLLPNSTLSGVYYFRFNKSDGAKLFIVVRGTGTSDLLVQIPTATMQAYNNYGGKSLYDFNSVNGRGSQVSLLRPNIPESNPVGYGFEHGWVASGMDHLCRWLVKNYSVEFATDIDIDTNSSMLSKYKCLVTLGHNEYWSRNMRNNLQKYQNKGGHVANFGGNTCWWQIRYENSNTSLVCYKNYNDPNPDPTVNWHDLGWSAKAQFGTGFESGGYNEYQLAPLAATAFNTDHWLHDRTGLSFNEIFGRAEAVAGYEVDGISPLWSGDVVSVAPGTGTDPSFVILGHAETRQWGESLTCWTIGYMNLNSGSQVFSGAAVDWGKAFAPPFIDQSARSPLVSLSDSFLRAVTNEVLQEWRSPAGNAYKYIYLPESLAAPVGWMKTTQRFTIPKSNRAGAQPLYRHYAATGSYKEILSLQSDLKDLGWTVYPGTAGSAFAKAINGALPIYRFINPNGNIGWNERLSARNIALPGESEKGIAFWAY